MNIVFCDITNNYPKSFSANNSKFGMLAKGLIKQDSSLNITFINESFKKDIIFTDDVVVNIGKISIYSIKNNRIGLINRFVNVFKILTILKSNRDDTNFLIFAEGSVLAHTLITYYSKKLGYKVGFIFHEWHIGFKMKLHHKINKWLMDYLHPRQADFILPISHFLEKKVQNLHKRYHILPIIGTFDKVISSNFKPCQSDYFLYCASVAYYKVIIFIINSFEILHQRKCNERLCLILSGNQNRIDKIRKYINDHRLGENIIILSGLSDDELYSCYSNSLALLIPLEPSITEKARFSQKIAEYLSSKRPIITTNVGEILFYFKDNENCYISDYNEIDFSNTMEFVIDNKVKSTKIGFEGYLLGKKYFSEDVISNNFLSFLKSL